MELRSELGLVLEWELESGLEWGLKSESESESKFKMTVILPAIFIIIVDKVGFV